ncbi:NAD/NADP octopine/nopaline dehydrogenase family protein [Humitalea sp. 24SJ18S-53]|uniref:NAD/NADP octopine/nopaline dehydrogenase family protein n=1 Tax=Humitalea sp. 24SJ18S-53 TaxID=3422307 RepID=UPI003D677DB9
MKVAVIGWSPFDVGPALAADLALAGHEVHFAPWPDQGAMLETILRNGGLDVVGGTGETISGGSGRAPVASIGMDIAQAVAGAEVVLVDCAPPELEARMPSLIPHLERGQVVHVNSHGYFVVLRLLPLLAAAGKQGVLLTESTSPILAAGVKDGVVTPHVVRRHVDTATFPGNRIGEALPRLQALYKGFGPAESILQTSLESMNLMGHAGLALANVGAFDRAEAEGRGFAFYTRGNIKSASILTEAFGAERNAVCRAYGVRENSARERLIYLYDSHGNTHQEAVANCAFLQNLGELPAGIWRRWLSVDVPYAIVPTVRLAEAAGVGAPVLRSIAEIFGVLLGFDPWKTGLTLEQLGLAGLTPTEVARLAREGAV